MLLIVLGLCPGEHSALPNGASEAVAHQPECFIPAALLSRLCTYSMLYVLIKWQMCKLHILSFSPSPHPPSFFLIDKKFNPVVEA